MFFEKGASSKKKRNKTKGEKVKQEKQLEYRGWSTKADKRRWARADFGQTLRRLELIPKPPRKTLRDAYNMLQCPIIYGDIHVVC